MALAESFKQVQRDGNEAAGVLATTLEQATAEVLERE